MKLFNFLTRKNISTTAALKKILSENAPRSSTVDIEDVEHLAKYSDKWWDVNGQFGPLHSMNTLRVQFVRDGLANTGVISKEVSAGSLPLKGVKIIDVGCGGGILSEPLARIGAEVTGLDASEEMIGAAVAHKKLDRSLDNKLNYVCTTMEEFVDKNVEAYDAVVASEVLEHVVDKELFLKMCAAVMKPGGSLFITTMTKNLTAWLGGIICAEHLLRLVPPGTHDWNKFITPADTQRLLEPYGCKTRLIHGMMYNPLKNEWFWTRNTIIHYALHAVKRTNQP